MAQLPRDFLTQLARKYELSPEQQEAFVERFSCDKSKQAIAETLHISSNAFRTRMTGVYKKFSIGGDGPGKYYKLRDLLGKEYQKSNPHLIVDTPNNNISLIEYLYVDELRLSTYFEQILSTDTDNKSIVNNRIELLNSGAEATQARRTYSFTTHEKISIFLKYLEKQNLVDVGRITKKQLFDTQANSFRLEKCSAIKVLIPVGSEFSSFPFKGLRLWISSSLPKFPCTSESNVGNLYLIEDFPRENSDIVYYPSGYTLFRMMREKLEETVLFKLSDERFSTASVQLLSELGAWVDNEERQIFSLYRVRATQGDQDNDSLVTTIGYPIIIAEANSDSFLSIQLT